MADQQDAAASTSTNTSSTAARMTQSPQPALGPEGEAEAEAGPSRPRSRRSSSTDGTQQQQQQQEGRRPASPSNTLRPGSAAADADTETAPASVARPSTPYLDLATYPTQNLLRLLASLLQQIASANDQLRPEVQEAAAAAAAASSSEGGAGAGAGGGDGGGGDSKDAGDGDDQAGNDEDDGASSSQGTRSRAESRSSNHTSAPSTVGPVHHPSPTTELFNHDPTQDETRSRSHLAPVPERKTSLSPTTGRPETLFSASKTSLAHHSSLLSFHARHIPSISIEAYLLRILKYCPTTNEVFLGLLVYFDRMSRLGTPQGLGGALMREGSGGGAESRAAAGGAAPRGFAIDSYNVHRLVIAGVTVASKFFSDVFYTNSRYAKVGGLPPHELNQLELQFLLLNDFRLVIPADEMQRYGNRLLGYWENRQAQTQADPTEVGAGAGARAADDGVGAPTPDQVKQASAMIKSESGSSTSASASASRQETRPTPARQVTQPANSTPHAAATPAAAPAPPRRSSFDGAKTTNIVTTA